MGFTFELQQMQRLLEANCETEAKLGCLDDALDHIQHYDELLPPSRMPDGLRASGRAPARAHPMQHASLNCVAAASSALCLVRMMPRMRLATPREGNQASPSSGPTCS